MSGLFDSYKEDYQDQLGYLRECMDRLREGVASQRAAEADPTHVYQPPPSTGPLSRTQQVQSALQLLSQLKDLITSMSYEANDVDPSDRDTARDTVEAYRRAVVQLDKDVAQLRHACLAADRTDLGAFGSNRSGMLEAADEETKAGRLTALQTTEKMQGGTSTLLKAEAYLSRTNDLGRESLNTLRAQTEQISHIHETTHDVDEELTQARRVINQMQRTAIKHKLWLYGIIILIIAFICFLFYLNGR